MNSTSATYRGSTRTAPRGGFGPLVHGGVVALERGEQPVQAVELAVGEAGADPAGVAQVMVVVLDRDEQRADALPPASLPRHPSADDDVGALDVLDLAPRRRPAARLVRAVQALGDDALQPLRAGGGDEVLPVADHVVGNLPVGAPEVELGEACATLLVGQRHEGVAVEPEEIEDDVGDRRLLRQALRLRLRRDVHPVLQALEARAPLVVERHDLPVEDRAVRAQRAVEAVQLGIALGDVVARPGLQAQPARLGVGDGAHAVPLDLEPPALQVGRQVGGQAREHRHDLRRHRLASRILGRIHPVDHPVLPRRLPLALVQREQPVAPAELLAVEGDLDLGVLELVGLVRAPVPDPHRPGAVAALRDVALELEVFERMVLGVDRHTVVLRVLGDAVRDRPGDRDAVVLEAQVPVQARRVVLLHHEAREAVSPRRRLLARRLRGALGPLAPVLAEFLCCHPAS